MRHTLVRFMAETHPARLQIEPKKQQAAETRNHILDAARSLIQKNGFQETTIETIAEEAGVAASTVYAVFGSKRGILQGLMERAAFSSGYIELIREVGMDENPPARLRLAARICRQIYDALQNEAELLRGAEAAPDFVREKEKLRYDRQSGMVRFLESKGVLRKDLTGSAARDILWVLTARDVYRMLVIERRWKADEYEKWLGDTLVSALIEPGKK
jgi:AcrR family transcriptional regulator